MAFASLFIIFILSVFLVIECISLGLFISGIVLSIIFLLKKKKEKIGNKVAIPIVLITLGIIGLIPGILFVFGVLFS